MVKKSTDILNTTFVCPFMKVKLEAACGLNKCPYYSNRIESRCIWEYVYTKNSISIVELSLILGIPENKISTTLKEIKMKLINKYIDQKLITSKTDLKYCNKCGSVYDLKKKGDIYECIKKCKKSNQVRNIENRFKKPINHILIILSANLGIGSISKTVGYSNKSVKDMYVKIFGDDSILARYKDIKELCFTKRKDKLQIRNILKIKNKSMSFPSVKRKIKKLKTEVL